MEFLRTQEKVLSGTCSPQLFRYRMQLVKMMTKC
jgi:hypothetical protein